ncbi:RNA polymerase sigma factor [Paenibacillus sp. PR3]|uniref:RNA polymerase sigma factor n=2 Tax=Paenibacillus terricola TaxID=2763503 RepID=A0ABR8N194_9BACL|nr:RNA polymerase sigma factor [Paenibacillus terricola]
MALTKSPWDAEDLMQEAVMKAYAILPQLHQPLQPKAYLFRIASNTWIDQCRRSKHDLLAFRVYGRAQMERSCLADWEKVREPLHAELRSLWGRTAVVVTSLDAEGAPSLSSVIELQIEDGTIVKWRDYYFSQEFLAQASVELGFSVDVAKEMYGN